MPLPLPSSAPLQPQPQPRALWQRVLWSLAGTLALATGIVGIFLPLLPTTPFVLLAAFCFSRGSARLEAWLLAHPRWGPADCATGAHATPCRCAPSNWPG